MAGGPPRLFLLTTLALDLTLSLVVATAEHQARTLPGSSALLRGIGATLLVTALTGSAATVTAGIYLLLFATLAALLLRRRDVT